MRWLRLIAPLIEDAEMIKKHPAVAEKITKWAKSQKQFWQNRTHDHADVPEKPLETKSNK